LGDAELKKNVVQIQRSHVPCWHMHITYVNFLFLLSITLFLMDFTKQFDQSSVQFPFLCSWCSSCVSFCTYF